MLLFANLALKVYLDGMLRVLTCLEASYCFEKLSSIIKIFEKLDYSKVLPNIFCFYEKSTLCVLLLLLLLLLLLSLLCKPLEGQIPVPPSNHVGSTPGLLYSSTHHSSESFIHLMTGLAQDA